LLLFPVQLLNRAQKISKQTTLQSNTVSQTNIRQIKCPFTFTTFTKLQYINN